MLVSSFRFVLLSLALLVSAPALAQTTLFEVSKGDKQIFVGGTIHLLKPSEFPLPEAFDQAYGKASHIYFETDLEAASDPAFGFQVAQAMAYPLGKTLHSELKPEVWAELQEYAEENQFPLQQFIGFNPALVGIVLTMAEAQRKGIGAGVDAFYYEKAKTDGKPRGELESKEDVLEYMKAMATEDGNEIIQSTLRDIRNMEELMGVTVAAWRKGDLAALDKHLGEPMRTGSPAIYQTLLGDRNKQWLPKIQALFNQEGTSLILVGSLHLTGEGNLLDLLREHGYDVSYYRPNE